jgi:hypothetical protein
MDDLTRPMTTGQWVLFFLVCLIVIAVATSAIALMVLR